MNPTSRRRFLSSIGATAALGLAGCTGNSQISNLKSRLGAANEREQRLQEKLNKTQAELNETQAELDRVETQRDELRTQLHNERQKTKELQTQLDQQNETISTLETRIEQKEQRITELESVILQDGAFFDFSKQTLDTAKTLGNKVKQSVAQVKTQITENSYGEGTAWHMGDGFYLTNAHVVRDAQSISLNLYAKSEENISEVSAKLLGKEFNRTTDMALLKAAQTEQPALSSATSTNLSKGDPLIQVGNPLGVGRWVIGLGPFDHYGTYREGDSGSNEFTSYLPNRRGNSGSPVLSLNGEVVGMTHASSPDRDATLHAPSTPFTHYGRFPELTFHQNSAVFTRHIQNWK